MRKFVTRAVLGVCVFVLLASRASAAPIAVGWLQWDDTTSQFSVVNQTGANYLGDPAFPVVTQLLFSNLNLSYTRVGGGGASILQGAMTSPDGGNSFDTAAIAGSPNQASLTGNVSPVANVSLDVDGGGPGGPSLWNLGGVITDVNGNPIVVLGNGLGAIDPGIVSVLYVNAERAQAAPVPEPMTLTLLGTGLAGTLLRRRRART